jgi:hypothetical protein
VRFLAVAPNDNSYMGSRPAIRGLLRAGRHAAGETAGMTASPARYEYYRARKRSAEAE